MRISYLVKTSCMLIVTLFAISAPALGVDYYVNDQASFQGALTTAASNSQVDTIHVSGTINISGSLTYYASPSENYALTIRDVGATSAKLSGDSMNRLLSLDSTGVQNNNDDNVHFTVQGIKFHYGNGDLYGGGIYIDGHKANMTIENCNFSSNLADSGGAGANVYSSSGAITLRGCQFTDNQVYEGEGGGAYVASPDGTIAVENNDFSINYMEYGDGVGVYIWGDTVTVTGNTFLNNVADGEYSDGGGGAYIDGDYVIVNNNTFTGNSSGSSSEGGGAYIYGYYSITMTGNDFTNNTAEYDGGGARVDCFNGDITMTDNVFTGNIAGEGGGAGIDAREGLLMVNNVFADNTANNNGGGGVNLSLRSLASPATVTNNTFTQNSAPEGGGLYIGTWENTNALNFYNNIVFGNTATTGGALYLRDDWNGDGIGSIVNLFNNNFDYIYAQDGDNLTQGDNIGGYPLLTGDYHLNAASPCIEAGNNDAPGLPGTDMDGDARIIDADGIGDATVDIGADEYKYIDIDTDGVPDAVEMGPNRDDPNYDGNDDGIPDNQQGNVASMPTYNDQSYVTVASPEGTALNNVQAIAPPGTPPTGVDFEYGCFDFTITGLGIGGSASVTLFGPEGATFDTFYKFGSTTGNPTDHWYEFLFDVPSQTGAQFNGNEITLHFVDGQRGDDDLIENGTVVEPGGPVTISAPACNGDFEPDGDVDGSDLALFAADFGRTDCSGDCEGDFDGDNDVDGSDLAVFAADFGRTDCP